MSTTQLPVVVIDDHPVVAMGLPVLAPRLEVLGAFPSIEAFLRADLQAQAAVLLDLQLGPPNPLPDGLDREPRQGTAAIRTLIEAGRGPVVIYTSLVEEAVIAACLAAGATGAAVKTCSGKRLTEIVERALQGRPDVDPSVAGALYRWAERRHAGALSRQQANALRYRAQGLTMAAIAELIEVQDEETVHRYLRAAVDKLHDLLPDVTPGRHPGSNADDLARKTGLASGLVRYEDVRPRRPRARS